MMLKKKSPRSGALKYLMLAPIVVTVLALNAETVTEYKYSDNVSEGIDGSTGATVEWPEESDGKPSKKKEKAAKTDVAVSPDEVVAEGICEEKPEKSTSGVINMTDGSGEDCQPLYVIDGKIADKNAVRGINPDEIDGIVVLKGEAAVSKYGGEAKNGVLEIKTKGVPGGADGKDSMTVVIKGISEGKVPETGGNVKESPACCDRQEIIP